MWQKIKVLELLGSKIVLVDRLPKAFAQIDLKSSEIFVDFSECIIDYPSTGRALDIFFDHISKSDGNRTLIIKIDFQSSIEIILGMLFIGSDFLKITDVYKLSEVELKLMIDQKLNEHEIRLLIYYGDIILELGKPKSS